MHTFDLCADQMQAAETKALLQVLLNVVTPRSFHLHLRDASPQLDLFITPRTRSVLMFIVVAYFNFRKKWYSPSIRLAAARSQTDQSLKQSLCINAHKLENGA